MQLFQTRNYVTDRELVVPVQQFVVFQILIKRREGNRHQIPRMVTGELRVPYRHHVTMLDTGLQPRLANEAFPHVGNKLRGDWSIYQKRLSRELLAIPIVDQVDISKSPDPREIINESSTLSPFANFTPSLMCIEVASRELRFVDDLTHFWRNGPNGSSILVYSLLLASCFTPLISLRRGL